MAGFYGESGDPELVAGIDATAEADRAKVEADRAESEANRAEEEADRAEAGAGLSPVTNLQTQTAAVSSEIIFNTDIDATYQEYVIKAHDVVLSAASDTPIYLELSTDGGTTWVTGTEYSYAGCVAYNGGASLAFEGSVTGTSIRVVSGNSATQVDMNIELNNPSSSLAGKQILYQASGANAGAGLVSHSQGSGFRNVASAVNAVRLSPDTGTFTSGEFVLYGWK